MSNFSRVTQFRSFDSKEKLQTTQKLAQKRNIYTTLKGHNKHFNVTILMSKMGRSHSP